VSTARAELTGLAELWEWDALASPTPNEVIYRRGPMIAFCQYDRDGKLRDATLRRMIADALTTEVAHVGWNDPGKATKVGAWMAEFGERPVGRAEMARRRARR
jgi:hypothetical protein